MLDWKPIGWAEEKGQISAGIGPALDRRCRERQAYIYREQFPTRGDKAVRAQSIRGRMALEGLYVPIKAPWYAEFKSELLSFPAGKYDDQVDALGLIGQLLDQMVPGQAPKQPEPPKVDTGYRVYNFSKADDWVCYRDLLGKLASSSSQSSSTATPMMPNWADALGRSYITRYCSLPTSSASTRSPLRLTSGSSRRKRIRRRRKALQKLLQTEPGQAPCRSFVARLDASISGESTVGHTVGFNITTCGSRHSKKPDSRPDCFVRSKG